MATSKTRPRQTAAALTDRIVRNAKARILRDAANGRFPRSARDLGTLHEYVDANEYLLTGKGEFYPGTSAGSIRGTGILNDAQKRISAWIRGGGLKLRRPARKAPARRTRR